MKLKSSKQLPVGIFWITVVLFILCVAVVILYYEKRPYTKEFDFNRVKFNETISQEKISNISNIISNIEPEFRNSIKSLYITSDSKSLGEDFWGVNRNGHIIILYLNEDQFKITLAHEICHSYSDNEDLCSQVAYKGWCYR